MADHILLSLCIPTYNRAALLSNALNAIMGQVIGGNLCERVEIVVSDNASTDATQALVMEVQSQHPDMHLTYRRQQANLGPDANILAAVRLARGTFAYILSDDDVVLPGAIARFVAELQARPGLAGLCPNVRFLGNETTAYTIDADYGTSDRDDMLLRLGPMLTFLSAVVFRTIAISQRDYADKIGTSLLQSFIFLDVLAQSGDCLFLEQPYVAVRANDAVSYNLFDVFAVNFSRLMQYARGLGYAQATTLAVLRQQLDFLQFCTYHFRSKGTLRRSFRLLGHEWSCLVKVYWRWPMPLLRTIALTSMPLPLIDSLRRVRHHVIDSEVA